MKKVTITLVSLLTLFIVSFSAAQEADNAALLTRLQQLEDTLAIQETQYCYGRAQDVVYRNYANELKSTTDGVLAFEKCFADNANISISLLGGDILFEANTLPDWVGFVYGFGQSNKYLSTRHLISNIEIEFTSPDSATVYSSGVNPHFIMGSASENEPAIDWIIGNYLSTVERIDGEWQITKMRINGDEYARTPGFYPVGQTDGSGNIGFEDNY
jgi:hypothetical protein